MSRLSFISAVALSLVAHTATFAQPVAQVVDLSGPRFGVTFLSNGVVAKLKKEADVVVNPVITQFGWQMEHAYDVTGSGLVPVTEFVMLVGGLDQNKFLPSISGLIGLRTAGGAEFGVGPNVTPLGAAMAFVGGVTYRSGALNIPVNLAIVPSPSGVRISVLSGFNMRQ